MDDESQRIWKAIGDLRETQVALIERDKFRAEQIMTAMREFRDHAGRVEAEFHSVRDAIESNNDKLLSNIKDV